MSEHPELRIKTMPSVYEPAEDSYLAADVLWTYLESSKRSDFNVLDVGAGSGILGLTAAMNDKVKRVLFIDSNRQALALSEGNMHLNLQKLHAECEFLESDLLSKVESGAMFDLIAFNPPYLPRDGEEKALEQTWYGGKDGIAVTTEFLQQAIAHLAEAGAILIVSSSFANRKLLLEFIGGLGLVTSSESKKHLFFEDIYATLLKKR